MTATIDELVRIAVRGELEPLREELRRIAAATTTARDAAEYLTVRDAAEFAKVNPCTIRDWLRRGLLPRHGSGKVVRIRRDELHAAMSLPVAKSSSPDLQATSILRRVGGRRR